MNKFVKDTELMWAKVSISTVRQYLPAGERASFDALTQRRGSVMDAHVGRYASAGHAALARAASNFNVDIDPQDMPQAQWVKINNKWGWAYPADEPVQVKVYVARGKVLHLDLPLSKLCGAEKGQAWNPDSNWLTTCFVGPKGKAQQPRPCKSYLAR